MRSYDDTRVGDRAEVSRVVSGALVEAFADLSGDRNPLHVDDGFAAGTRWGRRVAHGALTTAFVSAALTALSPGWVYLSQTTRYRRPVFLGETVRVEVTVAEKMARRRIRVQTLATCGAELVADGEAMMQELSDVFEMSQDPSS